tara:strand:+ start:490 stop:867 length:378 start_codon:yes stop_codon:yes gene_type:complete
MKLNEEILKRIIREELEEIRQSMIKPKQFGKLKLDLVDDDGGDHEEGYHITGASDPVELEILLKKAIEAGKLPSDMQVDMSVVDKTVYLKPSGYGKYANLKQAITASKKLEAMLQKLGLNIQRGE